MQTWEAHKVEKADQRNQTHCCLSIQHTSYILVTQPKERNGREGAEAFQESRETRWPRRGDGELPVRCSGMSTDFALARHCHPLCNRCNCPRGARSSPATANSHCTEYCHFAVLFPLSHATHCSFISICSLCFPRDASSPCLPPFYCSLINCSQMLLV